MLYERRSLRWKVCYFVQVETFYLLTIVRKCPASLGESKACSNASSRSRYVYARQYTVDAMRLMYWHVGFLDISKLMEYRPPLKEYGLWTRPRAAQRRFTY